MSNYLKLIIDTKHEDYMFRAQLFMYLTFISTCLEYVFGLPLVISIMFAILAAIQWGVINCLDWGRTYQMKFIIFESKFVIVTSMGIMLFAFAILLKRWPTVSPIYIASVWIVYWGFIIQAWSSLNEIYAKWLKDILA